MRFLATVSWKAILLIVIGWFAAWRIAYMLAIWFTVRAINRPGGSGGLTAVKFELSPRGVALIAVPPILLLALRLIAARAIRAEPERIHE